MKDKPPPRISSRTPRGSFTSLGKDRYFQIYCKIEPTGERFPLKNIYNEMTIKDLKAYGEFATGIPVSLQRLSYLDEGDLLDHTDIRHNDIVPGAVINLKVWNTWRSLVVAAATNDMESVFENGVTAKSDFRSPNSDYMAALNPRARKAWLDERAFVALFIAAHRGHQKLCDKLLQSGVNVNARTPYGRSPLHVAAAKGHGKIVDNLLENGADIDAKDEKGDTPLSVSTKFGNKVCERHLFLFRWQQRAKKTLKNKINVDMFAHQYFDSANPVWLKGHIGQIYYAQILPKGEYEGSSLSAPRRKDRPVSAPEAQQWRGGQGERGESDGETAGLERGTTGTIMEHTGAMPPIIEESSSHDQSQHGSRGRRLPPRQNKSATFDDWLRRKRSDEQKRINRRRAEERHKIQVEEDNYHSYF